MAAIAADVLGQLGSCVTRMASGEEALDTVHGEADGSGFNLVLFDAFAQAARAWRCSRATMRSRSPSSSPRTTRDEIEVKGG